MFRLKNHKGFTLVEMLIALAIVTILSAYAVPTFIGYIESANQTKRMNIARTIYLAAQNQLMEKRINKTLDDFSGNIDSEETAEISAKKVSETVLPDKMTKTEKENIVYISKKQGVSSGKVYELLDDVIQDKTVLNNAILIEYNKSTGFVLSVFYSEEEGLDFNYKEADKASGNFKDLNKASVSGKRPYLFADERRQGYCGIEDTGMLPPSSNEALINIRDGSEKDEALFYGKEIYDKEKTLKNVLYAEAIIKDSQDEYDLSVVSAKSGEKIKDATVKIIPENLSDSLEYALKSPIGAKKEILFKSEYSNSGKKLEKGYIRVIWILDYVKGDMLSQDTSIGKLYPAITPQDIKVNISGGSINATSMSIQNSHFAYEDNVSKNAVISSARHLNNVRYKVDGSFRQIKDIDMNPSENENITNFLPIGSQENPFIGKYIARKEGGAYSIENLKVDLTSSSNKDDAGLFGVVGKNSKGGEITGVRLENPNIKAASNVGTLAGQNSGKISLITVENNKTSSTPIIKGDNNVGGVIGLNSGILNMLEFIDKSNESSSLIEGSAYRVGGISGGASGVISNAIVISASKEPLVKSNYPSHLGGVVGESNAKINNVMYLAIAPKNETGINPIVGTFSGTIDKTSVIYLSGEAKRPTPIKLPSNNEYNLEKAYFGEPKSTKNIIKEVNFKNWSKVEGSNETNMLSVYPYPYQLTAPYKDGEIKNWPVVDEDSGIAETGYYEFYSDDTWGYSNSKTHPLKTAAQLEKVETDKNVHVINDGYFIEYPKTNGEYTFEVKSSDGKDIYLLKSTDWKWNDKLVFKTKNIEPIEYTKDGKTYLRLFLRNDILELASEKKNSGNNSSNNQVTIIVKKGSTEVLNTKINPLFAPIESSDNTVNIIRSPRQLDNIDKIEVNKNQAVKPRFLQRLNLDFVKYKRELKLENSKLILDDSRKISTDEAIVKGEFAGIYDGNNKYIRNVTVDGAGTSNLGVDRSNIGLFSEVNGSVKNIALLNSNFKGKQKVGGIAGTVAKDGSIENCELSGVIIENLENGSGNAIGGVVGENNGTLNNIYFNSTYRENGEFATPIKSNKEINAVGGIVGNNKKDAVVKNAYITAKGPLNKSGNVNIIVGAGSEGSSGTIENAYYLNVGEYNKNVSSYQGKAFNADGSLVSDNNKKIIDYINVNNVWEPARIDTTKETFNCKGLVYPYPKIKGMNHYFDWPVLINTLKYFEEYSDGTKGYYFNNGESITDTLKYDNPDITVVDEGYVLEVLSKGSYDVKFNSSSTDDLSNIQSEIFDGKIVIKLKHSQVEKLIKNENITKDGIKPIKIEVFKNGESSSFDILETKGEKTYFNPLFPKQIYYYVSEKDVSPIKTFEVRSPRHMLNGNKIQKEEFIEKTEKNTSVNLEAETTVTNIVDEKKLYLYNVGKFPYGKAPVSQDKNSDFFYFHPNQFNSPHGYRLRCDFETSSNSIEDVISSKIIVNEDGSYSIESVVRKYNLQTIETFEMNNRDRYYPDIATSSSYWQLVAKKEVKKDIFEIKRTVTIRNYNLKQTISINFGGADGKQVIGNRQPYKWEAVYNDAKSTISGNVISTLYSNYDAGVYFKDGKYYGNEKDVGPVIGSDGRVKRNRIYNLIMNAGTGAGGTFGTIESGVTVKNIEFVDPQIRMKNGRGGGIVANINYGTIDNVQVYNKEYTRSLFAYKDGTIDTPFLQSGSTPSGNYGSNLGGIAGHLVSKKDGNTTARITNCVVGTNSNKIADIVDNQKTLIYARTERGYGEEWATNRIGGIAGFVYGNAEVISSINIAEINAQYNRVGSTNLGSPFSVGGIAGSTGIRKIDGQVNQSFTGDWSISDQGNSPGHIIGCYNAGNVKLINGWVAGITGYPATGSTVISCYNTGRINIERDKSGKLQQVLPSTGVPIRIGGIVGESDGAKVMNCYNIGYISGKISDPDNSAAGAIMALPAYSNSSMVNCYSLSADQYRPVGILGKLYNNTAKVNGFYTTNQLQINFTSWQPRISLRNNKELVSPKYINLFPALNDSFRDYKVGDDKKYPVFNSSTDSFYIYPQLNSFSYGGVVYKNPHITPWEYIDSEYDAVLNYYENYSDDTFGYSYIDVFGNLQSSLVNNKVVVEDGYFIETAKSGVSYKLEINGTEFFVNSQSSAVGNKNGIPLTSDGIKVELDKKSGYNRIRVYTYTQGQDNDVNRLIGTNTVRGGFGKDIYFDYRFPKEIKYGLSENASFDSSKLKPAEEPYYIRTPRHMLNISAVNLLSEPKEFIQETSIDFSKFNNGSAVTGSIVSGEFKGSYNAQGYSLYNLNLNKVSSANVAIFESIGEKATVSNLRVVSPIVSGGGNVGVIAGLNKGKIKTVVIEKPSLTLTSNTASENNMGSICGDNQGDILDIFITDSTNQEAIFNISNSGSGNSVGGVVGKNSKNLIRVLYTTKAPKLDDNYIPITASNTGRLEEVYFLASGNYNRPNNNIGISKEAAEFKTIDIINWYEWSRKEGYPYPYLVSIKN